MSNPPDVRDLHDLFLVHDDAVSFFETVFNRQLVFDLSSPMLPLIKSSINRRSIDRDDTVHSTP